MRFRPTHFILLVAGMLSFSLSGAADDFKESPVAFGDNNHLEVRYDQRVTNVSNVTKVEHKHFVIYQGESAAQIKTLLEAVLAEDSSIRDDLQARRENEAFATIREALEARMAKAQISLDGLKPKLDVVLDKVEKLEATAIETKRDVEHIEEELTYPRVLIAAAAGWVGDSSARRWSNGVIGRVDMDFVLNDTESQARHNLVVSASFDGVQSDQIFLAPNGMELDRSTAPLSFRCGGDVGYAFALGKSVQFVPYAAVGIWAQWFASALTKDPSAAVGLRTGLETRIGSFRSGLRVGAEYSLQNVRQPTYSFQGLSVASSPDRESVSGVRVYLGLYFGLL